MNVLVVNCGSGEALAQLLPEMLSRRDAECAIEALCDLAPLHNPINLDLTLEGEPEGVLRGVAVRVLPGARASSGWAPTRPPAAGLEVPAGLPLAGSTRSARLLRRQA